MACSSAHLARHVGLVLPPPDRGFSVQLWARAAVVPLSAALGAGPRRRAFVLGCCSDTACANDFFFCALHQSRQPLQGQVSGRSNEGHSNMICMYVRLSLGSGMHAKQMRLHA